MRIITCNTNGIRSAANKGFFDWLPSQDADVICIQETKAQEHQLDAEVFSPKGYHRYFFDAEKKGYSGTAVYCKKKPNHIVKGLGFDVCDTEGRWLQVDFDKVSVISLYMPSGSSSEERQARKFKFMDECLPLFKKMAKDKTRDYVICADWNICHQEIDLKNWKANRKNSGFLPEEREWMDDLLNKHGFSDSFRELYPDKPQYTWWSNRGQAYANDVGWRLDYLLVTKGLHGKATDASVYKDEKFSDHAPLIIDYDCKL